MLLVKVELGESLMPQPGSEPYQELHKENVVTVSPSNFSGQQMPLEVGMMGYSLENIAKGERGYVLMPLGIRDSTKWGGRKWVKVKVTAFEDTRGNRDIIVCSEQGAVKEHTPVELSYEKTAGGYQRVGEPFPLPVTMGSRGISWVPLTKTDTATTAIITPVNPLNKIRIAYIIISSNHAAVADVGITFKQNPAKDSDFIQRFYIPADGGTVALNMIDAGAEGPVGGSLYVYCAAAYALGVRFNVGYREV